MFKCTKCRKKVSGEVLVREATKVMKHHSSFVTLNMDDILMMNNGTLTLDCSIFHLNCGGRFKLET